MSSHRLTSMLLPGLLALSLVGNAQNKPAMSTALKPGKSITQNMQPGQTYEYSVNLKAGEALKANVMQKGVDVVVTAYAPDGSKLAEFDSPTSTSYGEFLTVLAPATGRYRLVVTPFEPKIANGTFVMTLDGVLSPAQYAQSKMDDLKRADALANYLQMPHPDKLAYEQRTEMLRLDPTALMPKATVAEIDGARWLEGTWSATGKRFATPVDPELNFPARNSVLRFDPKKPTVLQMDEEANGKFEPFLTFEPLSRQWIQAYMDARDTGTAWGLLRGHDWQNNQLMLEGEVGFLGIARHSRQTWTKTDDRTMRVTTEERKADGSWMPVAETTYTKTMGNSITAK
jgi:hypothetical protein